MKKYTIEEIKNEDGTNTLHRVCDGFTAFELLGILELTQREIIQQMQGLMKQPDFIERKRVKDDGK